ncbi:MAG: KH domain-containing protein [Firmicutes bacterium]|nr:KH domain-containing protein [Bacillota bacterium]
MDIIGYTEFLVKSIVKNPDMVKVQLFESDDEDPIVEIIVHSDDMGTVIGKGGKMATSLRTLIQAYAFVNNMSKVKVNIDSF